MSTEGLQQFLQALRQRRLSPVDRAIAVLWWHGLTNESIAKTARELANEIEKAGFGQQNVTRLTSSLGRDPRTAKTRDGRFRIHTAARDTLNGDYLSLLGTKPLPRSGTVLPLELVTGTRSYIERVVLQLNASYDASLFDCCAVMCRRLLETLIIEVYEARGRADELKGNGDESHFMMFSGLLAVIEQDKTLNLGRNSVQGLRDFKKLGDQSAHNRRYNARSGDIDRVQPGLRVAVEELLHLANLIK